MTRSKPFRIALLAYDGCMALEIIGISDVLLVANHVAQAMGKAGATPLEVRVVSMKGRMIRAAGGIALGTQRPRGTFALLIVPGLEVIQGTQWPAKLARLQPELTFIRKSFSRGTHLASVCVGSFLLGEAGLLDGRQVTTAWIMAEDLARRYPLARVNPQAIVLEDGAVITTGAISSTFDLALHLVRRILGADVASATARIALLPKPRSSQAPYVDANLIAPHLPSFSASVTQWLAQRMTEPYNQSRLAQAFFVGPRTLLRRVKAETGITPLTLLQQLRVGRAKQLLHSTASSIEKIVESVGYADTATFSRLFVRQVGETPARYRSRK